MKTKIADTNHRHLADIFDGLAHPRRIALLHILKNTPQPMHFGALQTASGFSPQVLTHHLKKMEMGGIVKRSAKCHYTFFSLTLERARPAFSILTYRTRSDA